MIPRKAREPDACTFVPTGKIDMTRHKLILILGLTLPLIGCAVGQPAQERTRNEAFAGSIAMVLDNWHNAAAEADEARYFSYFTSDAVFLGTDATERWSINEFFAFSKPFFDSGKAWTFIPRDRAIRVDAGGQVAWFDEMLDSEHLGVCRGSGILVLTATGWKIAHYNLSIPIPNDLARQFVDQIASFQAAMANQEGDARPQP